MKQAINFPMIDIKKRKIKKQKQKFISNSKKLVNLLKAIEDKRKIYQQTKNKKKS